jgi:hypothetical protein
MTKPREVLEAEHGKVWDEKELSDEFVVTAIIDSTVVVRRRADNVIGTLEYQNEPRFYFHWRPNGATESEP